MASYLQKLRRQSKQLIPQSEGKHQETAPQEPANAQEPPKIQEPATAAVTTPAGPSQATQTQQPPPPTVTEPSEEVAAEPVLDEEDQIFLERLAAIASEPEGEAPPLPSRPVEVTDDKGEKRVGRDAQEALMDGADKVALPMSPDATTETSDKGKEKAKGGLDRKKSVMSYFSLDRFKKGDGEKSKGKGYKDKTDKLSEKDKSKMADDLHAAAEGAKLSEQEEQLKENKELTEVLDQLNLSAVNNRVFSFSKESEALLGKFTQILKDIINGVPTAYNDLEKLFTDYDTQLKKMYGGLPPFLQNMVKSLPAKLTATLGPELLAANAEKPGFDAKAASAGTKGKKSKIPGIPAIPSLKSLVTAQGAVATALKSIVNFLKFRFPMLATGTNLIMSLAVFLLLFVFWYCHKRGRETRLEKERLAAEEGESARVSSASSINEDNDSIFGDKPKRKPVGSGGPAAATSTEQPTEPLIIRDDKAREDATAEAMAGLPSVSHLPDPKDGKAPVLGTTVEK